MLRVLSVLIVLFAGAGAGLASAEFMLDHRIAGDVVRAGPWRLRPSDGLVTADPYARAERSRSGAIPLASGEGLTLTAVRDSGGAPLNGRCAYAISGAVPASRFWSISLFDAEGRLVSNAAERHSFNSTELSRDAQGSFAIVVGADARPGDWLPAPKGGFELILRLYDTPIGAGASLTPAQLPAIARLACA